MGRASTYISALKFGHKIYPEDLAGMIGLPYIGRVFYVDPTGGSDTANNGGTHNTALATVAAGYNACTTVKNDVVLIVPTGSHGRTTETTAISWAKRFTHLVGACAPTAQECRAGMEFSGTTGTATGSLTITENGCVFKNICLDGTDDVNTPVTISGDFNSFLSVDFKGSQNATTGDDTTARCLVLTGAVADYFGGCTFGNDSTMKSDANATMEWKSNASRCVFEDCRFVMSADAQTPVAVYAASGGSQQWMEFKNTSFYAFYTNHSAQVNAVFDISGVAVTLDVLLTGTTCSYAYDDWEKTLSGHLWIQGYTNTTNVIGLAIQPVIT